MASHLPDQCCVRGVRHDGKPKGKIGQIANISTYFSYPESGQYESAILIFTDFIGHESINTQLIADKFAATGYFVVMPDLWEGDSVPLNRPQHFDVMAWATKSGPEGKGHGPGQVDPIVETVIRELRSSFGIKKIGVVGYCLGAKYVARFLSNGRGLDAGGIAHPSFVDVEEIEAIRGPLTIAAAETDHIFSEETRHKTEALLKNGKKKYQINLYSGVEHGFALRADTDQADIAYAREAAFLQHTQWFARWL